MKDPNSKYWSDEFNDDEDNRRADKGTKRKYNRMSFIGPLVVFLIILFVILVTIIL